MLAQANFDSLRRLERDENGNVHVFYAKPTEGGALSEGVRACGQDFVKIAPYI